MRQLAASKATSPGADPGIFDWWVLVQRGLSANTGRHWPGKYFFASRGEQIIGGHQKTIKIFEQTSGLIGGGPDPLVPPPGSTTVVSLLISILSTVSSFIFKFVPDQQAQNNCVKL